jgi:hypothetical protein
MYNIQKYWLSGFYQFITSKYYKARRFGNWICFLPRVMGGRHILCWVFKKDLPQSPDNPFHIPTSILLT